MTIGQVRAIIKSVKPRLINEGHNEQALNEASPSYVLNMACQHGFVEQAQYDEARKAMGDLFRFIGEDA